MRFLVRSGTERAAEELLRTADTVLAVSPTRSATDFSVTAEFLLPADFSLWNFIRPHAGTPKTDAAIWQARNAIVSQSSTRALDN
jgi:hypothetical protein